MSSERGDRRTSNLVGMEHDDPETRITDMRGDVKTQKSQVKVIRSCRQSDARLSITRQRKVTETPK